MITERVTGLKKTLPISYRYLDNLNLIKSPLNLASNLAQSKVPIESDSSLWCMLAINTNYSHPMNKITTGNGENRFLYVDNMYTRHSLVEKIFTLSKNEIYTTGAVSTNFLKK